MYNCRLSRDGRRKNLTIGVIFLQWKWRLPKLKEWIDAHDPGAIMIPFSGALEAKLAEMDVDAKRAFCEENKIASSLDKIIVQGYKALQLIYFFTAGHDEVKAWTIQVTHWNTTI